MSTLTQTGLRLSPAALTRYRTCPKSYWFADVERLPRDERPSPVLAQANAVHEALKLFYGLPPEDRSATTIAAALRTIWRKYAAPGVFGNREAEASYGRDALAMLVRYFEEFDTSTIALGLEDWVSVQIGGTDFYGKIDRADRRRAGDGLDIIDYKTGRRTLEPEDLHDEPAAQIYLLGAEATFREPVVRVRFIYLRSGEEVSWTPEPEDVERARERLSKLADEIAAADDFVAFPGAQCRYCPFAARCTDRHKVEVETLVGDATLPF